MKGKFGPVYFRSWICHIKGETRVQLPHLSLPRLGKSLSSYWDLCWWDPWLSEILRGGERAPVENTQPGTSLLVQPLTVWWLQAVADSSKALSQSWVCWSSSLVVATIWTMMLRPLMDKLLCKQVFNCFGYIHRSGDAGLHSNFMFYTLRSPILFHTVAEPLEIPISKAWGF